MSAVFQSGMSNLGSAAVAKASAEANKYNQELQKREMVSQTEESLGGVKLFTSGRELASKIVKDSKIKPYLKQQIDKALGKAKQPIQDAKNKAVQTMKEAIDKNDADTEEAASVVKETPDAVSPELNLLKARNVSNDVSDLRLGRIGRIAELRKARKIQKGMNEDDAEEDMNNYIMGRANQLVLKNKLNDSFQNETDQANEAAQAEAKAATEARAALKAQAEDKPPVPTKGKVKGKGEDEEEEGAEEEEEGAEGAAEGGEISGMTALSSVLDAIPGLDIIGAALGIGGLAAGFAKKPPQRIATNPNIRSNASYSQQLGIDA